MVRNDKGCLDAGLGEIRVLARLQQLHDADTSPPYARLLNYFYYKEHLHIVLELLGSSLLRFNQAMGGEPSEYYNPNRLAFLSFQLLTGLKLMHRAKLIHCDVKPDNVCFASISRCTVKMIDFGACMCENDTLNSYVQSRWYRAPEVMLGIVFDEKIDMWSLGCLLAEMLLGFPLFHGASVPKVLAAQHLASHRRHEVRVEAGLLVVSVLRVVDGEAAHEVHDHLPMNGHQVRAPLFLLLRLGVRGEAQVAEQACGGQAPRVVAAAFRRRRGGGGAQLCAERAQKRRRVDRRGA